MQRFASTAVLATALASSAGPAAAQSSGGASGARTSGWSTTIHVEVPFPRPAARSVTTGAIPPVTAPAPGSPPEEGLASFYWQSRKTASGELFDKEGLTAAHRTLPFNTRVRVTNVSNGRSVVVRINDRGPFKPGRIVDLSWGAAGVIDMRSRGITRVKLEVLQ